MKVINLFGGPGIGKSCVSAGIFYELKKRGQNSELVPEFVKDLIYSKRMQEIGSPEYIFAQQNQRLHRLRENVEWAVIDSPLLFTNIYIRPDYPGSIHLKHFVYEMYQSYSNINILLIRNNDISYKEDEGRIHNHQEAIQKDQEILTMLESYNIPYFPILVNNDTSSIIVEYVLNFHR